jgi:hypothetical protein
MILDEPMPNWRRLGNDFSSGIRHFGHMYLRNCKAAKKLTR